MFKALNLHLKKCNLKGWVVSLLLLVPLLANAQWNEAWTTSNKIKINAQGLASAVPQAPVVVRLHSGNFDFINANIDGSDLRFIAADNKTELQYYIEKFDTVNELAVVWVQLPTVDPASKDAYIWVYSGNENATSTSNAKAVLGANVQSAFHFSATDLLKDAVSGASATGDVVSQTGGLIAGSATFNGSPLTIAVNPDLNVKTTSPYTWSAWVKPAALPQEAVLFSQGESVSLKIAQQGLVLNVGGVEISGGTLQPAVWQHIAFTINAGKANIYVDGASVANGDVQVVDEVEPVDLTVGDAFTGELDELQIANVARNDAWLKLGAIAQGVNSQLITVLPAGEAEGGEEEGEGGHNYFGILIDSLTLDAEIVIGLLGIMFVISVWVMVKKFLLASKTDKDNQLFLARFQKADRNDLLQLGKGASFPNSSLFKLYQAGLREISKRKHEGQKLSLSGASMDAIKAAIDADMVRETQRLNAGMVLLTIAISGGPFLGLLGTVVGVMITFAAIAAAGDVNVNAIAPGIAAALLATVAGLGVAIPALFGYNYLASRIKEITIAMQIFVDEFVTRSAELYGQE